MRTRLTSRPLMQPSIKPVTRQAATASQIFIPHSMFMIPNTMPERPSIDPTDKSIAPPPEIITTLSPMPRLVIRPYPQQFVSKWKLRDGTPLTIRPICPEDEPLMVKFHGTLSEQSVHFRYFGALKLEQRVAHEQL